MKRGQRMRQKIRCGQLTRPEEEKNSLGLILGMFHTCENLEGTPMQFLDGEALADLVSPETLFSSQKVCAVHAICTDHSIIVANAFLFAHGIHITTLVT